MKEEPLQTLNLPQGPLGCQAKRNMNGCVRGTECSPGIRIQKGQLLSICLEKQPAGRATVKVWFKY